MQDSLLQGCLPLAQSYVLKNSSSLEYHTGDDTEEATTPTVTTPKTPLLPLQSLEDAIDMDYTPSSPAATRSPMVTTVMPPKSFTYDDILATGMGLVMESLHREDVELARELIVNMVGLPAHLLVYNLLLVLVLICTTNQFLSLSRVLE